MQNEKKIEYVQVRTPDIMRIGEYVVKAKGANRTMAQFAEECDIGASTLSRIANGKIRKPLTEDVIRSIYEHRDEESNLSLEEFLRLNGLMSKEEHEQRKNYVSHQSQREESINRERQMKNAIVAAMIDRNVPVISGSASAGMERGRIEAPYGLTAFFNFAFFVEDAIPQNWCFATFAHKKEEKFPLAIYKRRIMDSISKVFLIDAWAPDYLKNKKISFVFCDQQLYEAVKKQIEGAPIKSAMSLILIDAENELILEEKWISSSEEISSVLSRPIQNIEEEPEMGKMLFGPEDYIDLQNEYWRKSDE